MFQYSTYIVLNMLVVEYLMMMYWKLVYFFTYWENFLLGRKYDWRLVQIIDACFHIVSVFLYFYGNVNELLSKLCLVASTNVS